MSFLFYVSEYLCVSAHQHVCTAEGGQKRVSVGSGDQTPVFCSVLKQLPSYLLSLQKLQSHRRMGLIYASQLQASIFLEVQPPCDGKDSCRLSVPEWLALINNPLNISFVWEAEIISLCSPGWPRTQRFSCLCFPGVGIKDLCHHFTWPIGIYEMNLFNFLFFTLTRTHTEVISTPPSPPAV